MNCVEFFIHFVIIHSISAAPNEAKLYETLLKDYNNRIRPIANSSNALIVRLGLVLQQIINVVCVLSRSVSCVVGREESEHSSECVAQVHVV